MFGSGEHFDAVIFEGAFVNCGFIFVAGKAIKLIDEDIVPVPFFAVGNHAFKIGPVVVGAGHGAVDISIENEDLVLFCIFFADMDLSFDRLLGLVFGRIAGVNDGCFQMCNSPFVISFSVIKFCKRARIFRQNSCLSLFCKAERAGLPMQRI